MGDAGYGYARFADDIVTCSPMNPTSWRPSSSSTPS
jgi:hypothetical protein